MRIFASTAFLPWIGSYIGSKSLSTSTPNLLFGRSMTWPFDASTMKSLPRNLLSVLDLVGDSTTTRFLPLALSPRLASIAASSTSASGFSAAAGRPKRPRRAGAFAVTPRASGTPAAGFGARFAFAARPAGFAFAVADTAVGSPVASAAALLTADFFLAGFSPAGEPAVPSVRDFLVAMRVLPRDGSVLRLERHACRHVARTRHLDRSLLVRRQRLEHALELVRVERAARAQVHKIAPRLGREQVTLLGREHALRVTAGVARHGRHRLQRPARTVAHGRTGEPAQPEHRRLHVVGRDALLIERLGQRLERQLVAVEVLLELARDQPQHAGGPGLVAAHAPVPTRSSAGMWHFLYFLPLPHGHGSLRPTRGMARIGCAAGLGPGAPAGARLCCGPGAGADAGAAAAPPLPQASASACCATICRGCRGASSITWRAAAGCTCTRNSRWTKSSRTSVIIVSNRPNASFLYCTSGSRWP